jgi:arginine-tRNA-protein transferase
MLESKAEWRLTPEEMDQHLANAWRHFGPIFVRYQVCVPDQTLLHVQPLRVVLSRFTPSKSHRRILRRNADLLLEIQPTVIDDELRQLFDVHKTRFTENIPPSLDDFLGPLPAVIPDANVQFSLWKGNRRVAASFLDLGHEAVSSVYGMFDPAEARRSLGILTMLLEMDFARQRGCRFYYHGYAFQEPSPFDYKKQFSGLESFDWQGHWIPMS